MAVFERRESEFRRLKREERAKQLRIPLNPEDSAH